MLFRVERRLSALIVLFFLLYATSTGARQITTIPDVTNESAEPFSGESALDGSFTISDETIANSPNLNIVSFLKQEQSVVRVTNHSGDSSQSSFSLRGFGDNAVANTLILVDGFSLTNPTLLSPNFNAIAISDIEEIKIIEGSRGTLYGDQAVGGVILITTKHPKKFNAAINAGLGSFNTTHYNAYLGTRFEKNIFVKGYHFANHSHHYRQHQVQSDVINSLTAGWEVATGDFSLTAQQYEDTTQFPGGLTEEQYKSNPRQATDFTNYANFITHVYQLSSKQQLGENWIIDNHLETRRINSDGFLYSQFNRTEWMNTFSPELQGEWNGNTILTGYVFQNGDYELTNQQQANSAHLWQQNIYAEVTHPLSDTVNFIMGGRYAWQKNYSEEFPGQGVHSWDAVTVTEQGLEWLPTKTTRLYLRRDGNFRFPKANEQVWTEDGTGRLQVESGVSYESGVMWHFQRHLFTLNSYQLNLKDEIAFDPTQSSAQPFGSFRNFTQTRRRGVSISDKVTLSSRLSMSTQLNYVDARFMTGEFSGKTIPAVPALNGNIGFDYQFNPHWKLTENALFTGRRYASDDDANASSQLPSYWLHTVALQFFYREIQVSAEVDNLFDQRYPNYVYYNPAMDAKTFYSGEGRSYLLSFKADIS